MAKAIMIQGTMSNAGKSLLAAGLCRIFRQDGYSVAPFKAQNMALNSFITKEGLEMGRAQVVQAEAAGIEPSVLMNPVLLKPTNNMASQVIVNGEVYKNLSAKDYYLEKEQIVPLVKKAYDQLAAQYDIIVLEGAGSPAEINLMDNDIVNMFMAKMAKAPVLLAGDIDRGGVFASLIGTMSIFREEDRNMVKGILINKFRGDLKILEPGLHMLEERIHVPVVGVVPYMNVDIDDEDSLTERFTRKNEIGLIDIAVIRIPRISNFTDFNVLEYAPGVSLRYVDRPADLREPDLIILPGTKNTMEDLLWMRQSGIEAKVLRHAAAGKPVIGICGGFQMLGEELRDPDGVEHGGTIKGMGLLPAVTTFEEQKTRTQAEGRFLDDVPGIFKVLSNVEFEGYEIHMGQTQLQPGAQVKDLTEIQKLSGQQVSKLAGLAKDNVYGTYIHGIFDREEVTKALVSALYKEKGLDESEVSGLDVKAYKEQQYDLLADGMRKSLDMDAVYRILENGV